MSNDFNVTNPYYSIINGKNFFGGTDPIRIVIIIYIFLSFILNTIIFITIGLSIKLKRKGFPLATWVMLSVLLMNFIHTFTYFYEWVITKDVSTATVNINHKYDATIGALLTGNPKNMAGCYTQGFFLIFSSISQDFLINIFFYLVDSSQINEFYSKLAVLILGIVIPFIFTIILQIAGGIGLNDKFCYVKKFKFKIEQDIVKYEYYGNFQLFVILVYFVRVLNFIASVYFLVKIWSYVNKEKKPKFYIFKTVFIPIIQLFTIGIGVIYRVINIFSPKASVNLSGPYLILNTVDGVLFPIGFILQNSIFTQIKRLTTGKEEEIPNDKGASIECIDKKEDEEEVEDNEEIIYNSPK